MIKTCRNHLGSPKIVLMLFHFFLSNKNHHHHHHHHHPEFLSWGRVNPILKTVFRYSLDSFSNTPIHLLKVLIFHATQSLHVLITCRLSHATAALNGSIEEIINSALGWVIWMENPDLGQFYTFRPSIEATATEISHTVNNRIKVSNNPYNPM